MEGIEAAGEVGSRGVGGGGLGGQPGIERRGGEREGWREGGVRSERESVCVTLDHVRKKQQWNKLLAASFSGVFSLVKWTLRRRAMSPGFLRL